MFCLICPQCKYSFVAIMYSKFFSCFILDDITQPVRILGGSYKWIIFPRQSYLTEELVPLLKWVPAPNSGLVYPWFFRFQPLYTGKKPVVTRFVSGLLFVCFIPQQQSCVYSSILCQWWLLIASTPGFKLQAIPMHYHHNHFWSLSCFNLCHQLVSSEYSVIVIVA